MITSAMIPPENHLLGLMKRDIREKLTIALSAISAPIIAKAVDEALRDVKVEIEKQFSHDSNALIVNLRVNGVPVNE